VSGADDARWATGAVTLSPLAGGGESLLLAEPARSGVDLLTLAREHREALLATLARAGAILFRGFGDAGVSWMQDFAAACSRRTVLEYTERSSPRTALGRGIYTSTEYPAREEIRLHNENSYAAVWPERLCFFCHTPAETGGETTLADTRRVLQAIAPAVRARFEEAGVLYARTFSAELGVDWRTAFAATSREEAERQCAARGYEWQWLADGRLRTRRRGPAVVRHPRSGERSWFNHAAFFHVSSLAREVGDALRALFPEDELPSNTYYGDGASIGDETIAELHAVYRRHTVPVRWQAGDALLVDNVVCAHGRSPFTGPRQVLVAMCDANEVSGG
jgi:alpha-ketoglutarate-dependent taurine dioxygenase